MTTRTSIAETHGVNHAAVMALSDLKREPDWLRQRRLEALDLYTATPMPARDDEAWRRTDVSRLGMDDMSSFTLSSLTPQQLGELPEDITAVIHGSKDQAGLLVQVEGSGIERILDDELAAKGVLFSSLDHAASHYPDIVQQRLGSVIGPGAGKFEALNGALWSGGVFVYVPANAVVRLPLHAVIHSSVSGLMATRTLIVAGVNAQVTLVEEYLSPTLPERSVNAGVVEIVAAEGARVSYVAIQQWGRHTANLVSQRGLVGRDATVDIVNGALGARLHRAAVELDLEGRGSTGRLAGMVFGDQRQHFDHQTLQHHRGEHTTSDAVFKTALTDRARAISAGLIRIDHAAQGTEAFLESRNMLLSDQARADSIPSLEILANDVRCKHAATVGRIDEEQLFYLMSRGVDRGAAEALLVSGFFSPIIDRVPLEWVREKLAATLAHRLDRARTSP